MAPELFHEPPEVVSLAVKLSAGEPPNERDKLTLRELVSATGWRADDVEEELRSLWVDPSDRVGRCRELFESYYREALEAVNGDSRQAAEKLWGSITALIKLHAALRGFHRRVGPQ